MSVLAKRGQFELSMPFSMRVALLQSCSRGTQSGREACGSADQYTVLRPRASEATAVPMPSPPITWSQSCRLGSKMKFSSSISRQRVPLSCKPVKSVCWLPSAGSPEPTE